LLYSNAYESFYDNGFEQIRKAVKELLLSLYEKNPDFDWFEASLIPDEDILR
jgi:hypothetical protein